MAAPSQQQLRRRWRPWPSRSSPSSSSGASLLLVLLLQLLLVAAPVHADYSTAEEDKPLPWWADLDIEGVNFELPPRGRRLDYNSEPIAVGTLGPTYYTQPMSEVNGPEPLPSPDPLPNSRYVRFAMRVRTALA